ncbi:MAG: hypothetical protein P0Y56_00570 [Candidatus Andeanibacterium colombiense]|uniref:Glycosyltransferase RgtA/B/C/D-like domain-containing protein n=1 Tax=Candidatus Andeanibacterium colombiense TaxID=3121345 RepID=A0AAJ5X6Z1_9SPHN|nr:MAG: hypothetical protein P0Y56_00570 [Sphingomonadaceae bacterium]
MSKIYPPVLAGARRPAPRSETALAGWKVSLVLLAGYLAIALLTRLPILGNPLVHNDEQFYLLVGSRMLDGALPFVDIWDRKPVGLFLIYAFASAIGPYAVVQYQLLAVAAAAVTALFIRELARLIAPAGAVWTGCAYLLFTAAFSGIGGQSPIFYNALIAGAAVLTAQRIRRGGHRGLLVTGCLIMLIAGLAIQVKYTAVFGGVPCGLALMWRGRRDGWMPQQLAAAAACWTGCALLPTLVAFACYVSIGEGWTFVQANFLSICEREVELAPALRRLATSIALLAPLVLAIVIAPMLQRGPRQRTSPVTHFLSAWAGLETFGFLILGTWHDHYALPLLVPLCALSGRIFGGGQMARLCGAAVLLFGLVASALITRAHLHRFGGQADLDRMAALVKPHLGTGCLYIHEGDTALYRVTGACIPTRFAFPTHLNSAKEQHALGIDTAAEMHRIIAAHPAVVVIAREPVSQPPNREARALLQQALRRNYRLIGETNVGVRKLRVYSAD